MAGAGHLNTAMKPPDARLYAHMWTCMRMIACKLGYKVMQVLVGTGFWVLLQALASLAWVHRLFRTPLALQKSQYRHHEPVQLIEATLAVTQAAAAGDNHCGVKGRTRGPIVIRAVAAAPGSTQPIILHNDPARGHDSEAWRLVGPYMKLYGRNAIANSQLFNREFIHFFVPGLGSVPYIVADLYNRVVVSVIGDPLSHRMNWRVITEMFVKEFPGTYFYHASAEYAAVLHGMGYTLNDVGAETTLQVQAWTYSSKTRTVRAAARSARDAGVRVRELQAHELTDEMRRQLQHEVSGDWLQQKAVGDRELRVFVRNVDYDNLQLQDGVRIFVAEQWDPAAAPPAVVDMALQGVPANTKPPKPPRNKSSRSLTSQGSLGSFSLASQVSGALSRSSSILSTCSSTNSLSGLVTSFCAGASDVSSSPSSSPGSCSPVRHRFGSSTPDGIEMKFSPSRSELSRKSEGGIKLGVTFADAADAAPRSSSLPATAGMTRSPFQSSAAVAAAGGGGPELIGFVLLDPLWENGQEVGYVSSICRMKRSAHQGTLKLLYEEVISKLKAEGKRELAFGFAPFFNVRDDRFSNIAHWIRWSVLYLYHCANNLYAFQNLAFSKIRYGAGVDGDKFRDPNVTMSHVYMACSSPLPGMQVLDLYVLCMYVGFMAELCDTWLKLVGLKKGGANLVVDPLLTSPSVAPKGDFC